MTKKTLKKQLKILRKEDDEHEGLCHEGKERGGKGRRGEK